MSGNPKQEEANMKLTRLLALLLCALLLAVPASAESAENKEETTMITVTPTWKNV